jgi:hypothetical protein
MALITRTAADVRPLPGAFVRRFTAGGSGTLGDSVYINSSEQVVQANAGAAGTTYAIGIIVSCPNGGTTFASGDAVDVLLFGPMAGFSGMTPHDVLYQSDTAGRIADAAGTTSHKVGRALSATVFMFLPVATEA